VGEGEGRVPRPRAVHLRCAAAAYLDSAESFVDGGVGEDAGGTGVRG